MKSNFAALATVLSLAFSGSAIAQTIIAANTLSVSPVVKQVADLRKNLDRVSEAGGSGCVSTFMTSRHGSHGWVVPHRMFSTAMGKGVSQPEALQALDFGSEN